MVNIVKWKITSKKYMVKIRELIVLNIIYGCFPKTINFIHIEISFVPIRWYYFHVSLLNITLKYFYYKKRERVAHC